jgi:putative heme iron utilization protein
MDEVVEARFVKEPRSDGRQSYSIRFFDSIGHLSMRANFIKLYDDDGNLIMEKVPKFDEIHMKHGGKNILSLRGQ